MAELKIIVFNVERGLCVYARTPNDYAVLIDCGRSQDFSPAQWIAENETSGLNTWNGRHLAWMVVTHPHDDHVEDIATIKASLPPSILLRHKSYDWEDVLNPPDGDPSPNAKSYYQWQKTYSEPLKSYPDLGLSFQRFALTPDQAKSINGDTQHLLNNSSYVTVLTYQPAGRLAVWKVVIAGDNETASWEALLRRDEFTSAIKGADFFVTSHHGHKSGFSQDLFDVMGFPILNITSERTGDTSVFNYARYARGTTFYGEQRYHLTTRTDGHIVIRMNDNLQYDIWASAHENS